MGADKPHGEDAANHEPQTERRGCFPDTEWKSEKTRKNESSAGCVAVGCGEYGLSYGIFTQRLTEDDEARIQQEYNEWRNVN